MIVAGIGHAILWTAVVLVAIGVIIGVVMSR